MTTNPRGEATARESALGMIRDEHDALTRVLHTLQTLLQRIEAGVAAPEFELCSAVLYYLDDFQERDHHPKEEAFLFEPLNAATHEHEAVIERLRAGHRNGAQAMAGLYRTLVHFQGGAPAGLQAFRTAVDAYAAAMAEHMRLEEDLMTRGASVLDEAAWQRVAHAFGENDDPLFGKHRRTEFKRLFHRIQVLTPRKLKPGLTHSRTPAPMVRP
jgi:hemerythrin-like domain-containing protein